MEIKDSGQREQFTTGMQRDTEDGKPRFSLLFRKGIPFAEQMITRWAQQLTQGAKKYTERNWEQARTQAELTRFKDSAARHFNQWMNGDEDEDHAAAVFFNINGYETTKWIMNQNSGFVVKTLAEGMGFKDQPVTADLVECRLMQICGYRFDASEPPCQEPGLAECKTHFCKDHHYPPCDPVRKFNPEKRGSHNERDVKLQAKDLCWSLGPECHGKFAHGCCGQHCFADYDLGGLHPCDRHD